MTLTMKALLVTLLDQALTALKQNGTLPADAAPAIQIDPTKDKAHGDFATNLALVGAKLAGKKPRELAQALVDALPAHDAVEKVEIAGPGFINFFLRAGSQFNVVTDILQQRAAFGRSQAGKNAYIQVEFVSANPTSALHVGHGRGAAYGATVANLLEAAGFRVQREYYVNDAGRQMNILGTSTWLRYLEAFGETFKFPSNGYRGDYIRDIANSVIKVHGNKFIRSATDVFYNVPEDEVKNAAGDVISGDKEAHIDGIVESAKQLLGPDGYKVFFDAALDSILSDIRDDLAQFGVTYDLWFSERSLSDDDSIKRAIDKLKAAGHIYEKGGALWFRSTDFGDDKDRVVMRDNGQSTYFASDIAYHMNKFERGFDRVLNIWGADHHGYIPRVKAALAALGIDPDRLDVLLVQFVTLWRGNEQVQMSSRSGQFVTLRELREEVSNDAARFYYVTRKSEQHIDFDLDLAKSQSKDNPVYYIQYAHARVCSVMRKLAENNWQYDATQGLANLEKLTEESEIDLVKKLAAYPATLERAALNYEPHQLANYLRELASDFHGYYNSVKVLVDDATLRNARLTLGEAVRQVIHNGLTLLGVSSPESM